MTKTQPKRGKILNMAKLTQSNKPRTPRQAEPKATSSNYNVPLIVEQDEDGYIVSAPSLQGCYAQGDTYEEAMSNIIDVLKLHLADRIASGDPISLTKNISVTIMQIAA